MSTEAEIIVVDDNPPCLHQLGDGLKREFANYTVVCLESERAFHEHVASKRDSAIALLMADAILGPLERGTDLLLFCRQSLPHVRRVLMSDKATRDDLEDAINKCALDGYVEKRHPLRPDQLALIRRLLATVRTGEPANDLATSKTVDDLNQIPVGSPAHANLFKNAARDLFAYIFYPWLLAPRTEVHIRNGTKAVDVLFQNAARDGMLADLKRQYESLLIPVETKNSKELESDFFSQLEGYLTPTIGRWGIICFRGRIKPKYLKQVRATHTVGEGKLVMLVTDAELVELTKSKMSGRQSRDDFSGTLDQFIRKKFDESIG